MKYHVQINNKGQIPKKASEAIREELLMLQGKKVTITIEKYSNRRTNQQNAYYWGVVLKVLSEHTGYTLDEMHEYLKTKFLGTKKIVIAGEEIERGLTTTKLTTTDYMGFIAEIQRWASEKLDCYIPDPEEDYTKGE